MSYDLTAASSHSINYGDICDLGTNTLTIALWAYVDTFVGACGFVNKRNAFNSANAWSIGNEYTAIGRIDLQIGDAAGTAVGASYYMSRAETAGAWYQYAATYDGSLGAGSRCVMYRDGAAQTTTAITDADVTPGNMSSSLVLGRVNNTGAFYYDGKIAEVAIWNVALTAPEIYRLYRGASPRGIRQSNLRFYDPLRGAPVDRISGRVGTTVAPISVHPPAVPYQNRRMFQYGVTAVGGTAFPWHYYAGQMSA